MTKGKVKTAVDKADWKQMQISVCKLLHNQIGSPAWLKQRKGIANRDSRKYVNAAAFRALVQLFYKSVREESNRQDTPQTWL